MAFYIIICIYLLFIFILYHIKLHVCYIHLTVFSISTQGVHNNHPLCFNAVSVAIQSPRKQNNIKIIIIVERNDGTYIF